VLKVNLDHLKS